jgi:hypothetical protein
VLAQSASRGSDMTFNDKATDVEEVLAVLRLAREGVQ